MSEPACRCLPGCRCEHCDPERDRPAQQGSDIPVDAALEEGFCAWERDLLERVAVRREEERRRTDRLAELEAEVFRLTDSESGALVLAEARIKRLEERIRKVREICEDVTKYDDGSQWQLTRELLAVLGGEGEDGLDKSEVFHGLAPLSDDAITLTREEWEDAAKAHLDRLGLTYVELEQMAQMAHFTSAAARRLWVLIGGTLAGESEKPGVERPLIDKVWNRDWDNAEDSVYDDLPDMSKPAGEVTIELGPVVCREPSLEIGDADV
jgi:hypothetical protein